MRLDYSVLSRSGTTGVCSYIFFFFNFQFVLCDNLRNLWWKSVNFVTEEWDTTKHCVLRNKLISVCNSSIYIYLYVDDKLCLHKFWERHWDHNFRQFQANIIFVPLYSTSLKFFFASSLKQQNTMGLQRGFKKQ